MRASIFPSNHFLTIYQSELFNHSLKTVRKLPSKQLHFGNPFVEFMCYTLIVFETGKNAILKSALLLIKNTLCKVKLVTLWKPFSLVTTGEKGWDEGVHMHDWRPNWQSWRRTSNHPRCRTSTRAIRRIDTRFAIKQTNFANSFANFAKTKRSAFTPLLLADLYLY